MTIRAIFIGVNKHKDAGILELNGARRDATALWALFTDTLPGLASRLLVDDSATHQSVRDDVFQMLEQASSDDVVVLFFAGHGTPGGHLVLHDTNVADIPSTAIAMADLATSFRESRAGVVLCILDCCFSGQAPARVLDVGARTRSAGIGLAAVAGEGRILLTACRGDESAWEQPGSGHGLLTRAVIDVFTDEAAAMIAFPDAAGEVIRRTRVEAERIAVTQTPVFLGTVTGGLTFPTLLRGPNYQTAFPTMGSIRVTGPMTELAAAGFPPPVVDQWATRFPDGLNELQRIAINDHGVLDGKSLLVVAPTSSGKTMIGELAALQAVSGGKKAVFLLPYRALVNEKFEEFSTRYAEIGLRIVRCTGDYSDGAGSVLGGRYDLAFLTYEMFLNLSLAAPSILSKLGLVVLDEGQFITDPQRGITVELIFALLLRARERSITPQVIVLSAVIGNVNAFDRWLGVGLLVSKRRPVPLIEGVLDRTGTFQYIDTDGATKTEQFLPDGAVTQRREKPSSQDVIVPLIRKLSRQGEKVIVFRNRRGPAQGCAKYLAAELGLSSADAVLSALPVQDLSTASQDLRASLAGGTAFHNTNLLAEERAAVERAFRDPTSAVRVLAATTTLAAGINTPASTVVLAENEFVGDDGRQFTVAEYKNMAGRAGRLGFSETGKAMILADTPLERAQLFRRYVMGLPEDVRSSFRDEDLATWALRLLSQVRRVRVDDVPGLLVNTFGGFTASLADPGWTRAVTGRLSELLDRMIHAGLAERDGEFVQLTLLGQACGGSSLSFESALRLVELLRLVNLTAAPPHQLLALVQVLPEMDAVYTPLFKRGSSENTRGGDVARRYGASTAALLQRHAPDQQGYWQRCKRAAMVWDWIEGVAIEEIEKRYTVNPFQGVVNYGDIIKIAEATRFHLRSAHKIIATLVVDDPEWLARADMIARRLEFGLPETALPLLELRTRLTRGQYLALHRAGFARVSDVLSLGVTDLAQHIGEASAATLAPKQAAGSEN
jgi:helicase